MAAQRLQRSAFWELTKRQHGVVTGRQLRSLGWSDAAIKHGLGSRRIHLIHRGVFSAGRPTLSREGQWLAAVLACGESSALSHTSAAAAWGIEHDGTGPIEVSVPVSQVRRHPGLVVHRRGPALGRERRVENGIPITSPVMTLVDLAARRSWAQIEQAVNRADKLELIDFESVRKALPRFRRYPGVARLRAVVDRHGFVLTRSELERRFLPIARSAGLPLAVTGAHVNGFEVDFFWPDIGLVVETDGLRYHRTPAAQARDRLRDQAHTAAGLTQLRFTHHQVRHRPGYVRTRLMQTVRHLRRSPAVE